MRLLFKLLMRLGFSQVGPAVTGLTTATQTEGTSLVHTVTLASSVVGTPGLYQFSLTSVTASTPSDYTSTPTFSNGVTLSLGVLSVPIAVSGFTVTVPTSQDTVYEGTETYTIRVGNMTNTGTISDDESAPTVTTVSSASATEGSNIVHTVTVTGTAQAAQTYAISIGGGTATGGGTDYTSTLTNGMFSNGVTISGGNISVPAGVTSFTVTIPTVDDILEESTETYTLTIGGASGTGTINDNDSTVAFTLTISTPVNCTIADSSGTATVTAGGSSLTLSVTESVSSGVAPFAVFFDATASTSTETTRPQHDVFYMWDFGDTGAGTWSNGTGANTSRNLAYGPVASHMFETAGTYTVTLTAYDGVSSSSTTKTITVTAADTEWATTKTVCYSTNTDFTGAPAGCVQVSNVTDISASFAANKGTGNKRHLLHAGQTFAIASRLDIDVGGPSMIGKFGSGANPIINSTLTGTSVIGLSKSTTPTGVSDWRFQDFTIDCNNQNNGTAFASNGSYSKVLINRVYMTRCYYGLLMSASTINSINAAVPYTHAMWDQVYMMDSTIYDLYTSASGPNSVFANGTRVAVLGCLVDNNNNGEHGIRFQYCNRGVFSSNTIQGIPAGKTNLTIRGLAYLGDDTLTTPVYSEKIVISDNKMIGGDSIGIVGFGPQNTTSDERGRNFIFERNWIVGSVTTQNAMLVNHPDITIRNNLAALPGPTAGFLFGIQPSGVVPVPDRVNVYNNTCYYGGNTSNTWDFVWVSANNETSPFDQDMPGSVFEVRNNILYAPNRISNVSVFRNANGSLATTNQSNNTSNVVTDPLFATSPPTAIAHFTTGGGSYAQAGGVNVKNWRDFYNTSTQATPDIGAVVI